MTKPVIVKRSVKGAALTFTELDTNFQNLDDATITLKAGSAGVSVASDLNGIITLVATDGISLTGNNTTKEIAIDASLVRDTTPQLGGNLDVQTFKITTSVSNGDITIEPNGVGDVLLKGDTVIVGDSGTIGAVLSNNGGLFLGTQGAQDVEIVTFGGGTGSGRITITGTANGNIILAPDGTGDVQLVADTVVVGDNGANTTISNNGSGGNLVIQTGGTYPGKITITDGVSTDSSTMTLEVGDDLNVQADRLVVGKGTNTSITTLSTGNLTLSTNTGTNSGTITIAQGVNGNITIEPNGTGDVYLSADTVRVGDLDSAALITSNGTGSIKLNTNGGTNTGEILINSGVNANIEITPNGTGDILLQADTVQVGDSGAAATLTTNGAANLTISTNNGTNSTTMAFGNGVNGNITVTPNGTGAFIVAGGPNVGSRTNSNGGAVIGRAQTTTSGTYLYPGLMAQKNRTDILTAAMTVEPAIVGFSVRDSALVTTNFGRLACTYQGTGTNPFFRFSVSADNYTTEIVSAIFGGGVALWGSAGTYTHTTSGTTDLIFSTNNGTNSGTITILDGVNGNITIAPNGTGVTAVNSALTVTGRITGYDKIHGSFYHDATITPAAANTAYVIPLNTTISAETSDISIATSTLITIAKAGIYNIQFSLQLSNSDTSNEQDFDIWLRKNGADVTASNTQYTIVKKHSGTNGHNVAALNFLVTAAANDYFELAYAVTSTSVTIEAIPAITSPYTRPATPSVIVTVVPVGA
jgi:hypothetical protein